MFFLRESPIWGNKDWNFKGLTPSFRKLLWIECRFNSLKLVIRSEYPRNHPVIVDFLEDLEGSDANLPTDSHFSWQKRLRFSILWETNFHVKGGLQSRKMFFEGVHMKYSLRKTQNDNWLTNGNDPGKMF